MLTHRTNVLLTKKENDMLVFFSKERKMSKNQLIREALAKVYYDNYKKAYNVRKLAVKKMQELFSKTDLTAQDFIDYKHHGHKY